LLKHIAKRKLALAVTGALIASGLLTSSALAAPTGSITIGPRLSTGQLTAQFYTTSDLTDPTYGFDSPWFPKATLAAPGEQCVGSSLALTYVGNSMKYKGSQQSDQKAFYADAGTLCLWVETTTNDYLVASAVVPPKSAAASAPAPAPAQAPAPAAPTASPLSVFNARSAALAKAKQLWHARKPKVIGVHRVSSSKITCRVMWRSKNGTKHTRSVVVSKTSAGVRASAA